MWLLVRNCPKNGQGNRIALPEMQHPDLSELWLDSAFAVKFLQNLYSGEMSLVIRTKPGVVDLMQDRRKNAAADSNQTHGFKRSSRR
jgi:hypothetical protein